MANEDIAKLSDETQVYKLNNLSSIASTWNNSLSKIDIGSIDVSKAFALLISNGVANNYFKKVDNCIKSLNDDVLNLVASISYLVSEQSEIDSKGKDKAGDTPGYTGGGRGPSGGTNPDDYDKTKDVELTDELLGEFSDFVNELDDYDHIALINALFSISNNNLHDLLFNENTAFSNELKVILEDLLKKGKITEEVKNKLLGLGTNEVQVLLRNALTNGSSISDFSKVIYSSVNVDKSEENVKKLSDNFISTYSEISYDDIQKDLKNIYDGNVGNNVSDDTISVTRNFIDTMASLSNTTADEVLTNESYAEGLRTLTSDLIKTFAYIDAAGNMGNESLQKLCSNLIVRGNSNA